jgi:hypothetical protein
MLLALAHREVLRALKVLQAPKVTPLVPKEQKVAEVQVLAAKLVMVVQSLSQEPPNQQYRFLAHQESSKHMQTLQSPSYPMGIVSRRWTQPRSGSDLEGVPKEAWAERHLVELEGELVPAMVDRTADPWGQET